jgi:hypothetical protein
VPTDGPLAIKHPRNLGWASPPPVRTVRPTEINEEKAMPTLRIEHPITDFETWSAAFDRFADARRQAGVHSQRVLRPVDDANYVLVDLEFETTEAAEAFLSFLTATVWATPENSPALAATPQTRILTAAASG